ncbi:MAG: DNA polymerase I [Chloroflexi bacterium]|nr:DNA polymerase I [Chloroflexota bacterium]
MSDCRGQWAYTAAVPLDVSDRPDLLVILDSHGIIYRSYFALREAFASTVRRTGEPVWAVYGYANSLLYTLDELHPTHIIAAWDGPGPTFRHDADAEYKATREPMPDDLKPQLGRVRELLDAFRIPVIEAPGFEADDVLGTLATQAVAAGIPTVLVTLDTDMVQLVQPGVRVLMYRPYQRDYVLYDEQAVRERWSFGPERMTDYKALVGDSSDNIAGVKGIGEKGAKALIEEWGSLEEMLDHLEELKPPRAQKALAAAQAEAQHYKRMATIVTEVPDVVLDLAASRVHEYSRDEVLQLFQELEFRSLVNRLPQHADLAGAPASAEHAEGAITRGGDYELVTTPERLAEVVAAVRAAGRFGFEVVADDEHPVRAAFCLVGVALSIEAGRGWYLPFGHTQEPPPIREGQQELDLTLVDGAADAGADGTGEAEAVAPLEQLPREAVLDAIAPLFTDPAIARVSNNGKNQLLALGTAPGGFWTQAIDFDTSIAGYVLGERSVDVRGLAFERLGHELVEPKSLLGTARKAIPFSRTAPDDAKEFAAGNADATLRLADDLAPELAATALDRVFREIDIPHIPVLARLEQRGLAIDREALEILGVELAADIEAAERGVYEAVGHEFQIGSPQQLSQVLFEELELPKSRKTTTGWTTDANALEPLRQAHPAVAEVLRWRELTKIKSTYVDTLPLQVNPHTGRVHTVFSQTTAATGRLSSNDPNLQNIPVRTAIGNAVRSAFVARDCGEDPLLLSLDYSQIELRILAHVSGDEALRAAFLGGADIHRATASRVFGVEPDAVDAEMRRRAKVFNFGVLYGLTAFGLSQREGIPRDEAEEFIRAYFEAYPTVALWRDDVVAEARARGYAETLSGRRRYIPELSSRNRNQRQGAERIAINMPIQGTAADIIKIAMNQIDAELLAHRKAGGRAHMVLQVHDELLFELPRAELDAVREIALRLMPSIELTVPLELDQKLGRSWGEMK